ncbi:Hypothetical predicted protein [Pelobates cultripes]|uniref:Uncharacterized protein n=1 Tax=Pelobates cultripes TaxID=61616 RepID=A0AAD1TGW9_PELCU|nr:Hypothetical predicted protein [Pelobates cultripes]
MVTAGTSAVASMETEANSGDQGLFHLFNFCLVKETFCWMSNGMRVPGTLGTGPRDSVLKLSVGLEHPTQSALTRSKDGPLPML